MTENRTQNSTLLAIKAGDEHARQALLNQFIPLIIKTASGLTGKYMQVGRDEEISVGMLAVNEAIEKYNPERGASFSSFATLVVKNRIRDYLRSQRRHDVPVSAVTDDLPPIEARQAWVEYMDRQHQENRRAEVVEYVQELKRYNLDLKQLSKATPRHRQARFRAVQAARLIADTPMLSKVVLNRGELPLRDMELLLPVSRKTLERQRKYILAMFILISGNYYYLRDYLPEEGEGI